MMTKGCSKELQKQKSGCRSGGGAACRRSYLRLVFLKSGEYFDHFMHSGLLSGAVSYFQGQHSIRPQLRGRLFPIPFAAARKLAARLESPRSCGPLSLEVIQTAHPPLCHLSKPMAWGRAHDTTSPDIRGHDSKRRASSLGLGGGLPDFEQHRIVHISETTHTHCYSYDYCYSYVTVYNLQVSQVTSVQ